MPFQQGIIKKKQKITKIFFKNCQRTLGIFAVALIPKPFHSVLKTSMGAFSLFWNLNKPNIKLEICSDLNFHKPPLQIFSL